MPTVHSASYEFGPYRLSSSERILYVGPQAIKLPPKIIETLLLLVENPARVIEKEEFLHRLWPDTFVEEINLARNISVLRKTLSEGADGQQFIETIPKRGYRFLVEVQRSLPQDPRLGEPEAPALLPAPENVVLPSGAEIPLDSSSIVPQTVKQNRRVENHWQIRNRGILTIPLLGVILLGLLSGSWYRFTPENPISSVKSLAVLPIKITGAGEETDYIGFGITDVLIGKLGSLPHLSVRPTSAITKYTESDAMLAGRALQADAVITGHAYLSGDRLRVLAQMVRVPTNQILWSGTFDGDINNLFALQDAMGIQLANVLTPKQTSDPGLLLTSRRSSISVAQTNYLKGRYFEDRREWEKAFQFYQAATQADPQFAPAWVGMARGYCYGGGGISQSLLYMPKAKECALRALQLDDGLSDAHSILATVLENYDWDWRGAEQEYRKANALPNCTAAHLGYSEFLAFQGRFNEAIVEVKRVLETDPLSLSVSNNIGTIHYYARQYDQAIEWCQKTLELNPQHAVAHLILGAIYEKKGMRQESLAAYLKSKELSGEVPETIAMLKQIIMKSGWTGYWRKELEIAQAKRASGYYPAYILATIYARLGETENAKRALREAFSERALMTALKIDPILDEVRNDPEVKAMIAKIGLGPDLVPPQ